jgi:predicted RNA binding protein YcfA (HicA-like mRNA interferase family)
MSGPRIVPKGFYRDVVELLKAHGCRYVRAGKGDHEIWHSPLAGRNFTVDGEILSRHTANAILKQAGLPKSTKL